MSKIIDATNKNGLITTYYVYLIETKKLTIEDREKKIDENSMTYAKSVTRGRKNHKRMTNTSKKNTMVESGSLNGK